MEKNIPDPDSGQDLDPDNLGYTTSLPGRCNQPNIFAHIFLDFGPWVPTFATDPSDRVGYRVGSSGTPPLVIN